MTKGYANLIPAVYPHSRASCVGVVGPMELIERPDIIDVVNVVREVSRSCVMEKERHGVCW